MGQSRSAPARRLREPDAAGGRSAASGPAGPGLTDRRTRGGSGTPTTRCPADAADDGRGRDARQQRLPGYHGGIPRARRMEFRGGGSTRADWRVASRRDDRAARSAKDVISSGPRGEHHRRSRSSRTLAAHPAVLVVAVIDRDSARDLGRSARKAFVDAARGALRRRRRSLIAHCARRIATSKAPTASRRPVPRPLQRKVQKYIAYDRE